MAIALLAAALLTQPPTSGTFTARQLYDGCVRVVARPARSPRAADAPDATEPAGEAFCEASMAMELAAHAANEAMSGADPSVRQTFCPPAGILEREDTTVPLARAYIAWFEQHPAEQNSTDAGTALDRALAETWPCPH